MYVCACAQKKKKKQVQRNYYLGQVKKLKEKMKESYSKNDTVPELTPECKQSVMDDLNDTIVKLKIELVTVQDDWNNRYTEGIRGHQGASMDIKGHQGTSGGIMGCERASGGHQGASGDIRGH